METTEAVTHRLSRSRMALLIAVATVPVMFLMYAALSLIGGVPLAEVDWASSLPLAVATGAAGGIGAAAGSSRRPDRVRFTADGVAWSNGREPMFLPWTVVRSAGRRFAGPFAQLVITWSDGRVVMDIGLMTPRPRNLRLVSEDDQGVDR